MRFDYSTCLYFVFFTAALALAGCTDDFGTPCDFPQSPEVQEACGTQVDDLGNASIATCVDNFNADCNSRICVSFQGSSPFCSDDCTSDGDCDSDATCQIGSSGRGLCVPSFIYSPE